MIALGRPSIESPLNIDYSNDYDGRDRGFFLISNPSGDMYYRVKSATLKSYGLNISPGFIEYKLERFNKMPVTDEDYAEGVELPTLYDVLAASTSHVPISIEYWAKTSFIRYFNVTDEPVAISADEKLLVQEIGNGFSRSMCKSQGDVTFAIVANYTLNGLGPLKLTSYQCKVTKNGVESTLSVPLATIDHHFDPVLHYLDSTREV